MDLDLSHPAIEDLRRTARHRIPRFVWEYLDSGTGDEASHRANMAALDAVRLRPAILRGTVAPDLSTTIMGRSLSMPVGIAPVGMSGLVWPDAERILARLAAELEVPYGLSTVAAQTPETVGPCAGDQGWFQLYPPGDADIRRDMLARARDAGFHTLVLTADVAVPSRRERQRRSRLTNPMKMTPGIFLQAAMRPRWAVETLRHGKPRLRTLDKYAREDRDMPATGHVGYLLRCAPDWDYVAALRQEWDGSLVVKGVLDPEDAVRLRTAGVDGVWVSNHGGRQFSAAPASLDVLPDVRAAVPEMPVIWDGGVRSGTDVLRAIAFGADLVMLGRAVHYGLAAFGAKGARHVFHILREGMIADMGQMGLARPEEARGRLMTAAPA
ncbi:alpha-hydroxy acid oxidase [Roseitranquillus sediminis]|uniref:alpha-hydroxy acid oxidase n=1 Tax=Roseitranquillus sediminis TaxID=2809051 RepID=UPI001D0C40C0|nr:alpha-hydroxy acid oxidase [Roseitranquillus sediminis]MBM9594591.1 alpha-hydroxy-acid oxidizing protein [Roseitranquillus sediminis]